MNESNHPITDVLGPLISDPVRRAVMPWLIVALILVLLTVFGFGFWAGGRWSAGAQARHENKALKQANVDLTNNALELRQAGIDAAADIRSASARQGALAKETLDVLEENRARERNQAQQLEQLLRDRPDLRAVDVGPDLLCAWNRARQGSGAGADAATPGCGSKPAGAVRGTAPGHGQQPAKPAAKQPVGRTDAPSLHRQGQRADRGGQGTAGHDTPVVLQRPIGPRRSSRWRLYY